MPVAEGYVCVCSIGYCTSSMVLARMVLVVGKGGGYGEGGKERSIGGKAETTATNDRSLGKFWGICVMHCHESTLGRWQR